MLYKKNITLQNPIMGILSQPYPTNPTANKFKFIFSNPNSLPNKKPAANKDVETKNLPGFSDFPLGHVLAMGSLAAALPEMSKMPESPPGFYGFDPLNLKDCQPETAKPKRRCWTRGFPVYGRGGGLRYHSFLGCGIKVDEACIGDLQLFPL